MYIQVGPARPLGAPTTPPREKHLLLSRLPHLESTLDSTLESTRPAGSQSWRGSEVVPGGVSD